METEIDIVKKQQEKTQTNSAESSLKILTQQKQKLEKFALNQISVLEDSMKYLNEESAKVNKEIKVACDDLTSKMTNIDVRRKELPDKFCRRILDDNLI